MPPSPVLAIASRGSAAVQTDLNRSFTVSVPTLNGQTSMLEGAESIYGATWKVITEATGDGTVKLLTDPPPNARQRFYRIRTQY